MLAYLWPFVDRGWIPHDDGMLAQIAARVLDGELPHRDFDDPYTGLLGYVHAAALGAFGHSLRSLRLALFAFAVAWLPAVYLLARRFASRPGALLVAALALAWTLPNYFAGVPSYYNVFLATFGTLALVRHVETGHRAWLPVAGLCGGLSFLIKSAGGLYFIAAALLFLVYRERATWQQDQHGAGSDGAARQGVRLALSPVLAAKAGGAMLLAFALARFSPAGGPVELLHVALPGTLVALILVADERSAAPGSLARRIARLWSLTWPFALGATAPVVLFLLPYIWSGSLRDFVQGVFVLPARRFEGASFPFPGPATVWPALPYGGVLLYAALNRGMGRTARMLATTLPVLLLVLVAFSAAPPVYQIVWQSARHLAPFIVAAGCVVLAWRLPASAAAPGHRQLLFLLVAMAAFMPLLQVPFAAPVYFAYSTPFLVLAAAAVLSSSTVKRLHGAVAVSYVLFAVLWMNSSYVWALGVEHVPYRFVEARWVWRAGIHMLPHERDEYSAVMQVVGKVPSTNILALPDCPEVYFLSGRRNPTRHIYEFLAPEPLTPGRIRQLLDAHDVSLVVINRDAHFYRIVDGDLLRHLEEQYPYSAEAGRFLVRWRL
jgi:hypothetical protein